MSDTGSEGTRISGVAAEVVATTWFLSAAALSILVALHQRQWSLLTLEPDQRRLFWLAQASGWFPAALLISFLGGGRLVVLARSIRASVSGPKAEFTITFAALSVALAGCCWMSLRHGYMVTPDAVVVRAAEPWEPDRRIPLDGLTQVYTGCSISPGKGGARYEPTINLMFGLREQIDLGFGVGADGLAEWTEQMSAVAQLPQFRRAQWAVVRDPKTATCLEHLAGAVSGDDRSRLLSLLGYY